MYFGVGIMAKCQIEGCNRTLKSGWKYCFEHRHTAQAEALRGDRIINEATDGYIRKHKYNISKIFKWIYLSSTAVFLLIAVIATVYKIHFLEIIIVPLSLVYLFLLLIGGVILIIVNRIKLTKSKNEVSNRNPEYLRWVKGWVKDEKEEREFKKSLLK